MFKYIVLLLFLLPGLICAQTVEECMDCHSDEEMTGFISDTVEVSMYVDLEKFQKSIHGDMECIDCHSSVEDVDHDEDLPEVICADCHEDSEEEYRQSIHGLLANNGSTIFSGCKNCHGTHDIFASDDSSSHTFVLNIENTCGKCHSREDVISILGLKGKGPAIAYHESVHNNILSEQPEKGAPTCNSCHGSHNIYLMSDPRSTFNKVNRAETCGECHEKEKEEYYKSIHWHGVERGHFEAPTCNDCHGEHGIMSPQDKDAVTNRLHLSSQICANCHAS